MTTRSVFFHNLMFSDGTAENDMLRPNMTMAKMAAINNHDKNSDRKRPRQKWRQKTTKTNMSAENDHGKNGGRK